MCAGDKYAVIVCKNDNAALYSLNNLAFKDLLALKSTLDLLPALVGICSLLGELCDSFDVTYADNESFNLVTDLVGLGQLYRRIVGDLVSDDNAGNLGAEVKLDLAVRNRSYDAFDGVSCI